LRVLPRPLLLAGAACALGGCAAWLAAGWVAGQRDGGGPARQWVEQVARGERLEGERFAVLSRNEAKQQVAGEVVAGRLSLAEAVARYRALNDESPYYRAQAARFHPAMSQEERLCREVIGYAEAALRGQPGRAERVLSRLERDLRDHLAGQGAPAAASAANPGGGAGGGR
jgi:hypothetical protein